MMADDWAGFSTTEESLHAQWAVWVDYAMLGLWVANRRRWPGENGGDGR